MFGMSDRKSCLVVRSERPYNAEPPLDRLRADRTTPQDLFYVRSHGTVPAIDAAAHRLSVSGRVTTPLTLSLADLRERYEPRHVTAVLQCAGNRRGDMNEVGPVSGDLWDAGAIGNAVWTGVSLADVLRDAGAGEDAGLHVAFSSLDEIEIEGERFRYGVSIPMRKASSADVLLAWEMNGEALAPEHGYPLRVVVPGYAGVRSPKWLCAVTVQDRPSDNHMQQRDYKLFPSDIVKESADWLKGMTIDELPLNAAICEPARLAVLPAGRTAIRGYAVASARVIARVDVSPDGGRTWRQAELESDEHAPWSWTFWSLDVDLAAGEHELVVRAVDAAGQAQPALADEVWNFKGYLSAAWHRVRVRAT